METTKTTEDFAQPQPVSGLDMAFGTRALELMPKYADIPEEFKRGHTKWNDLFNQWFYSGLKNAVFTPKQGIDQSAALRHLRTVIASFEPQHEMSLWFDDIKHG